MTSDRSNSFCGKRTCPSMSLWVVVWTQGVHGKCMHAILPTIDSVAWQKQKEEGTWEELSDFFKNNQTELHKSVALQLMNFKTKGKYFYQLYRSMTEDGCETKEENTEKEEVKNQKQLANSQTTQPQTVVQTINTIKDNDTSEDTEEEEDSDQEESIELKQLSEFSEPMSKPDITKLVQNRHNSKWCFVMENCIPDCTVNMNCELDFGSFTWKIHYSLKKDILRKKTIVANVNDIDIIRFLLRDRCPSNVFELVFSVLREHAYGHDYELAERTIYVYFQSVLQKLKWQMLQKEDCCDTATLCLYPSMMPKTHELFALWEKIANRQPHNTLIITVTGYLYTKTETLSTDISQMCKNAGINCKQINSDLYYDHVKLDGLTFDQGSINPLTYGGFRYKKIMNDIKPIICQNVVHCKDEPTVRLTPTYDVLIIHGLVAGYIPAGQKINIYMDAADSHIIDFITEANQKDKSNPSIVINGWHIVHLLNYKLKIGCHVMQLAPFVVTQNYSAGRTWRS